MGARTADKDSRRAQLIEAAARVFSHRGYSASRVSEIATEAGVGKGTVYEYFSSKEDLFFAVFEDHQERIRERVDRVLTDGGSALERLEKLLAEAAAIAEDDRELHGVTLDFWSASIGSGAADKFETTCTRLYCHYRRILADLIREGQAHGMIRSTVEPETVAIAVVAALDGLTVQHSFDPKIRPLEVVRDFTDVLITGLKESH